MMKYNGIVRRLDGLGRIVIPREFRKLHKIKESDPLEIVAMDNGEILIRKFDSRQVLFDSCLVPVSQIREVTGLSVMVSDMESFVHGSGEHISLINSKISDTCKDLINKRKGKCCTSKELSIDSSDYVCIQPIFSQDNFGALFLFSDSPISEDNDRLIRVSARIMAEMLQKY